MKRKFEPDQTSLPQIANILCSFWQPNRWSHVELGAANYGDNVDGDSTHAALGGVSHRQFNILFKTADELIEKNGNHGLIYINDLDEDMVAYTIKKLRLYLDQEYPDIKIQLSPLVGNFFEIDLPKVDSIHLKNPEFWFFRTLKEKNNRNRLAYFAEHSKEGLILTTYFQEEFLPIVHKLGVVSKVLNDNYCPYIHADGGEIKKHGNVVQFSINTSRNLQTRLRPRYQDREEDATARPVNAFTIS